MYGNHEGTPLYQQQPSTAVESSSSSLSLSLQYNQNGNVSPTTTSELQHEGSNNANHPSNIMNRWNEVDEVDDDDEENENEDADDDDVPATATATTTSHDAPPIRVLMKRLRCVFGCMTFPIVPLGLLSILSFLWFLFTAVFLDINDGYYFGSNSTNDGSSSVPPCSHPLRAYAWLSLLLALYIPQHAKVRLMICSRSSTSSNSSSRWWLLLTPRRMDQIYHTLSILYVYVGVWLMNTCRGDTTVMIPEEATAQEQDESSSSILNHYHHPPRNTCEATCPHITQALTVYASILAWFLLSLATPLFFLPFVYMWFLRQAAATVASSSNENDDDDPDENVSLLRQLYRQHQVDYDDHEDIEYLAAGWASSSDETQQRSELQQRQSTTTIQQILDHLQEVVLKQECMNGPILVVKTSTGTDSNDSTPPTVLHVKDSNDTYECCICMSDLDVVVMQQCHDDNSADIEAVGGGLENNNTTTNNHNNRDAIIVRIPSCGHLFHKDCITHWMMGRWRRQAPAAAGNDEGVEVVQHNISPTASRNHRNTTHSSSSSNESSTITATTTTARRTDRQQQRRRARRTTCPLCRAELLSSSLSRRNNPQPQYNTFG